MRAIPRIFVAALLAVAFTAFAASARPLRVVAANPDLGDLAQQVGGDEVSVTLLAKGPQDPHFIEPRPSFIRALHRADVFVEQGMQLEIGWAPSLLRSARNPDIVSGGAGFVDASSVIAPLEVPTGRVDRSMGDVHPFGNPHYLSDPLNGLRVARLLRDTLSTLRPESAQAFDTRYRDFAERLIVGLVGEELARGRDPEDVARDVEAGSLEQAEGLGGWLGAMRTQAGAKAVQDHRLWPYFAKRFGLELVATLEPKPGIAPTTRHLKEVVEIMQAQDVGLILSSPYFNPRHARWVAEQTGARVVPMAHQTGSREGTPDYLATIDYNVRAILGAE
jgi:ABC-type Zn uptake system ZnuABC Zn-binding protein ZnuA